MLIIRVGGESEIMDIFKYKFLFNDIEGKVVIFDVYGIDKIIIILLVDIIRIFK